MFNRKDENEVDFKLNNIVSDNLEDIDEQIFINLIPRTYFSLQKGEA